ncbi:MAG TPA: DNA polymerase III subunit delta [Bacteroidales bacterium]|nr:DNA polymerase III subunit delta [Bacteroidales bacterium]
MAKSSGLTYENIMAELRQQKFRPVYLLMGDEAYYIDLLADYFEKQVLDDMAREFDLTVIYGKDLPDMTTLVSTCQRYPMMGERQVVILKEAQTVDKNKCHWDSLTPYIEHYSPRTILVICYKYGSMDARKQPVKAIESVGGAVLKTAKLYDNQVEPWINNYARANGIQMEQRAVQLLAANLGADLLKIVGEIDKLRVAKPTGQITAADIEKYVGISKDFNTFELISALSQGNAYKCYQITQYFADNEKNNAIQFVLTMLFRYFSQVLILLYLPKEMDRYGKASALGVSPYVMADYENGAKRFDAWKCLHAITWIREADAKSKGVGGVFSSEDIYKELIFKLLN